MTRLTYEVTIRKPVPDVFAFHTDLNNLRLITPARMRLEILDVDGTMDRGTRIEMKIRPFLFPINWTARVEEYQPNRKIVDMQEKGPFKLWRHCHEFHAVAEGTRLVDIIEFQLPLHPLSWPLQRFPAAWQMNRLFNHRHLETVRLLGQ